jgi:hypothetical protein
MKSSREANCIFESVLDVLWTADRYRRRTSEQRFAVPQSLHLTSATLRFSAVAVSREPVWAALLSIVCFPRLFFFPRSLRNF